MACKRKLLAIAIMALIVSTTLTAQTFDNDACYIVETDVGTEYMQRFEWQQLQYIQKYEFLLEKRNERTSLWEQIDLIETKDSHVELPLDSGSYRYKITVFNLLGQPELSSEWIPVEIIKVYQPAVDSVTPSTIYLENQDGEVIVSGKGLLDNSRLTFKNEEGFQVAVQNLGTDEKSKELTMFAEPSLLMPGVYTLTVENDGGLTTSYTPITVKFRKPWDLDISFGYNCMINLLDGRFQDYFGRRIFPYGVGAKISFLPWKQNWGYLGFGVSGSYVLMNDITVPPVTSGYEITGNFITGYLNFVYQYAIRNHKKNNNVRAILEARAGAGIVMLKDITFHFPHNIDTDSFDIMYLSAQFGGSAQYYLTRHLYAELSADFSITPSTDMFMCNIAPSVMIGWQF